MVEDVEEVFKAGVPPVDRNLRVGDGGDAVRVGHSLASCPYIFGKGQRHRPGWTEQPQEVTFHPPDGASRITLWQRSYSLDGSWSEAEVDRLVEDEGVFGKMTAGADFGHLREQSLYPSNERKEVG